jgi:hypothetical protein
LLDSPRMRPTLLDLLVLVASIAVGLALLRWRLAFADVLRFFGSISDAPPWRWSARSFSLRLSGLLDLAIPCSLTGTLGVLILRLIPPRPRLPRLARQPGFVACSVFLAVATLTVGAVLVTLGVRGRLGTIKPVEMVTYFSIATGLAAQLGGLAVAVAWSVLAMAGRFRMEASLVDRLGRMLGWFWIASSIVMADAYNSMILGL